MPRSRWDSGMASFASSRRAGGTDIASTQVLQMFDMFNSIISTYVEHVFDTISTESRLQ